MHQFIGPRIDGVVRFSLAFSSGNFISKPYLTFSAIDRGNKEVVQSTNEFEIRSTGVQVQCDILAAYTPISNLKLLVGPWLRGRIFSSTVELERVVEPTDAVFPDTETSERTVGSGKGIESFPIHYGLLGGVGYDLKLSDRIAVRPILAIRCDGNALLNGLGQRSLSFEGALSARLDFSASSPATESPASALIDTVAILSAQSHIEAAVDLFNLDTLSGSSDTAAILAQRTVYRQYVPLPPVVYFNAGVDSVPVQFNQFATTDEALKGLHSAHADPIAMYHNILNVIGKRLQETGTSSVVLRFSLGPGESSSLGRIRAERIRDYLAKVWSIRGARITIAPDDVKSCGARFAHNSGTVSINVSEPGLMSPTISQWMVDDHTIPNIGLRKKIVSALGVKEWSLTIEQHGRQVTHISQDDFTSAEFDAVIPLPPIAVDSIPAPLIAELIVSDYVGAHMSAHDRLNLKVTGQSNAATREIRSFYFLDPWQDCPTFLSSNKTLIDKIASTTQNGARITVSAGPRASSTTWGAGQIAEDVLKALNAKSVHPAQLFLERMPVVTDASIDRPDEDLFAQSVRVTIEQPLSKDD